MSLSDLASPALFDEQRFGILRAARHKDGGTIGAALARRKRRELIVDDGRLLIIAADHPARGALGAGQDQMAMADRYDLLGRLAVALQQPGVDGVLGTPDVIEDLTLLGALEGKIAVGSMNRGGLHGAVFEMDDRYTGYSIDTIVTGHLDAAKLLLRINLADRRTAQALESAARAVDAAARAEIPIMLEPFVSLWRGESLTNDLSTEAVITSIAISSGLGGTSAYSWLKLPVVKDMERIMSATTLPTLLLGGDVGSDAEAMYESWERALALPGVHGMVVGRTLLYPQDGDVARAVQMAASLVHSS